MKRANRHGLDAKTWRHVYNTWLRMKARCLDPDDPMFARHGGVGISLWPAWQTLDGFAAWAAGSAAAIGLTLERIDGERDFEPSNCRWEPARPPLSKAVIRSDGRRFETMSAAARETPGCNSYRISLVCRGLKKTCGGFGWRFETDQDPSGPSGVHKETLKI